MKAIWLVLSLVPRWGLEIVLWLSYVVWVVFDSLVKVVARLGPLGCLPGIFSFLVYLALSLVSAPFFVLYMLIRWVDVATGSAGEPDVPARLDAARASFYWPHIILYWLMPKLYGVEIVGPGVDLTYGLRDLDTDQTVFVRPGAKPVAGAAPQ